MSAWLYSWAASGTIVAPASRYASSRFADASPAPACTSTSMPSPTSWPAIWGVSATRVSPSAVSRGTPIFMGRSSRWACTPRTAAAPGEGAWRFGNPSVAGTTDRRPAIRYAVRWTASVPRREPGSAGSTPCPSSSTPSPSASARSSRSTTPASPSSPGRIFGLLGANGAGKTTAMRIVLDILRADDGRVTWMGTENTALPRSTWGYLPEERGLYPKMKVGEQLRFFSALYGVPDDAARARSPTGSSASASPTTSIARSRSSRRATSRRSSSSPPSSTTRPS